MLLLRVELKWGGGGGGGGYVEEFGFKNHVKLLRGLVPLPTEALVHISFHLRYTFIQTAIASHSTVDAHRSHGNVEEGDRGACNKAALAIKGTAPKRCKLCESQQHHKNCVDHRLKVERSSVAAEKAAAAPKDLLGQSLAPCRRKSKKCV